MRVKLYLTYEMAIVLAKMQKQKGIKSKLKDRERELNHLEYKTTGQQEVL